MTETETQICRGCGCTDEQACAGGCSWAEPALCSACAAVPTKDRLAAFLTEQNLPFAMISKARKGGYDEWLGETGTDLMQLRQDLLDNGRPDLAQEVVDGRWDGTKAEAKAWTESEEGQAAFAELTEGLTAGKDAPLDRVAAKDAIRKANPLKNENGEQLPLKHPEMMLAAVEIMRDAGASNIEISHDGTGRKWEAKADVIVAHPDGVVEEKTPTATDWPSAEMAAETLARMVVDGKTCPACDKPVQLGGDRSLRGKVCRYKRTGAEWLRGCK